MYLVSPIWQPPATGGEVLVFTPLISGGNTIGMSVYKITSGPIVTPFAEILHSDSRNELNPPVWVKADAVKYGDTWYVVLAGDVETYGGDLFSIASDGTVTDITADLGITWISELFGPTAIAKFNGGLMVVTDQYGTSGGTNSQGYKFSPDGTTWSSMTPTVLAPQSFGSAIAGSGSNAFTGASGSTNAWLSTDGLAYTDTGVNTASGAPDNFLTFNDGGIVLIAVGALNFNYIDSLGLEYGWSTFNMWANMRFMLGYVPSFGGSPVYGVFHDNSAFILAKSTTNTSYVVEAPLLADLQTDGLGTRTQLSTGEANGFGIFRLSATEAVAVTNLHAYHTADFTTWNTVTDLDSLIVGTLKGAGGHNPDTVTTPTGWLVGA